MLTSTVSTLFNAVHLIQQGTTLPVKAVRDVTSRDSEECLLHAYDVTGSLEGVAMLIRPGYKQAQVRLFTRYYDKGLNDVAQREGIKVASTRGFGGLKDVLYSVAH